MAFWAPEHFMQRPFGRRAPPQRETPSQPSAGPKPARTEELRPAPANLVAPSVEPDVDVDREVAEWKAARKVRKRSFREPWRSVCIAATLMFGVSSWLLPDSVADVAQLVTMGLAAASFYAGLRKR
jgi:hypothetical protein